MAVLHSFKYGSFYAAIYENYSYSCYIDGKKVCSGNDYKPALSCGFDSPFSMIDLIGFLQHILFHNDILQEYW